MIFSSFKTSRRKLAVWVIAALVLVGLAGAGYLAMRSSGDDAGNFSQRPGFAAYFSRNPRAQEPPDAADRALLDRHRPRLHLPEGHPGLIGFYDDYIAQGVLKRAGGPVISYAVDQALLNRHKHDPDVVFEHRQDSSAANHPIVLARIDRQSVDFAEAGAQEFVFLTYHAVFRHSGLAAGLLGWQILLAGLFGDLDDWHQLDHYTAVTVVLDERMMPVAILLQQHNSQRTHLLHESYVLPADGRPEIDVAIRSNELYLHHPRRARHRVVRFPGIAGMKYLLDLSGRPFVTADDITDPAREADYELGFLPPGDAFYTFQGYLGARRVLPGRSGPPGADYNTLPILKSWRSRLLAGYWRAGNEGDAERLLKAAREPEWMDSMFKEQAKVFAANLACARRLGSDCEFE